MKVLFICNQGEHRSKTAEELFKGRLETKSVGLYSEKALAKEQLSWADIIIVMEDEHRAYISRNFPKQYMQKRIVSLDIPDIYHYNQPELINILKSRLPNNFS